MKPKRFYPFILAAVILGCLGLSSCKKDYQRLMYVTTTSINASTYLAKGEIIDVGSGSVEYGFCYGTTSNPGINNSVKKVGTTSTPQSYQANLSSLTPGSTYYMRSYVKNGSDVVYGDVLKFSVQGGEVEYIYDNGAVDYSWRYTPGSVGYMGNLFPVTTTGTITSVQVYFKTASDAGQDPVSFTFFDSNRSVISSTYLFTPSSSAWMSVTGLNIPYSGSFYAMVFWNNLPGQTNFLAEDQTGPNVSMDLAYYNDSGTWGTLSSVTSAGNQLPGIFLIRVTVQLPTSKGMITTTLDPAQGLMDPVQVSGHSQGPSILPNAVKHTSSSLQSMPVK